MEGANVKLGDKYLIERDKGSKVFHVWAASHTGALVEIGPVSESEVVRLLSPQSISVQRDDVLTR